MHLPRWSFSSSSSSSSPSSSSSKSTSSTSSPKNNRRLTRATQLRHLRDCDIIHSFDSFLNSPPPHSHRHRQRYGDGNVDGDDLLRSDSSPSPHPLPLPELSPVSPPSSHEKLKSNSNSKSKSKPKPKRGGSYDSFRLPSPTEVSKERETDFDVNPNARVVPQDDRNNADSQRRVSARKGVDARVLADSQHSKHRSETWSSWTVPKRIQGAHRTQENLGVDITFRSAPPSSSTSPLRSPQGNLNGDPFYHPLDSPGWSESVMMNGYQHAGRPESHRVSFDGSPFKSPLPKSPRPPRKSISGPPSPLHPSFSVEVSSPHQDSNFLVNGHPLPLPPTPSSSMPASPAPQVTKKPEFFPMQWTKGKLIGRGTFGSVYVATNRETGALCAMKEVDLFHDDPKSAECIRQLEQEINVLSQLKHPNIVQYYGSEIVDDKFYIYLEYVYPGSINKYIREHCGAITEAVVRNFTRHILSGLAYLHGRKTIHRDIKGANLLVDAYGVVKLADFGMAKLLTGQAAVLSLRGSPYWMAPELIQAVMHRDDSSGLAFAVDIWSLGCTIIEMLTGKPPWNELEGAAAMFKVLKESPPVPESLSFEGKDFLRCCFQRDPADRPPASKLLDHPFIKSSQQVDIPSSHRAPDLVNQMDRLPHSPRERCDHKLEKIPMFPSRWTANGSVYIK